MTTLTNLNQQPKQSPNTSSEAAASIHETVLLHQAVERLEVKTAEWYVDGTFGGGGHTNAILEKGGKVIAFDFDQEAISRGEHRFSAQIEQGNLILIRENFDKLQSVLQNLNNSSFIGKISGVLFDFGTSVDQLKSATRGFSFDTPEVDLDMRMDTRLGVKASDLLKVLSVKQLTEIFGELGGEENARRIAEAVVKTRQTQPHRLDTVGGLVDIIASHKRTFRSHLHPATKVFQGLRIAVNDELSNIHQVLPQALAVLKPGGIIVTIAFHEGEDRIVKQQFKKWDEQGFGSLVEKKAATPSDEEIARNPRSRSAKLRVFRK